MIDNKKTNTLKGQYVKWDDVAPDYPDMWLCFKNAVSEGPDIVEGVFVEVLSDEEVDSYRLSHIEDNYSYERTTESSWNGIIESDFSIAIN